MDENQVTSEERDRSAVLREEKNKARNKIVSSVAKEYTGKAVKRVGGAADQVGSKMRQGGTSMMRAGAGLSSTGVGAIAGVPLMALGGLTAAAGLGTQGVGKAAKVAGRVTENSGQRGRVRAAAMNDRLMMKSILSGDGGIMEGMPGGVLKKFLGKLSIGKMIILAFVCCWGVMFVVGGIVVTIGTVSVATKAKMVASSFLGGISPVLSVIFNTTTQ